MKSKLFHNRIKNMDSINLHFYGPFSFFKGENSLFHSKFAKSEGIYLWIIKNQKTNSNFIHYVGETTSFAKRHREHIIHILGLNYMILDAKSARNGIEKILWAGMWRNKTEDAVGETLDNYDLVTSHVIEYIRTFDIYFAPTELESSKRKHIEGCIGWNLRNKYPQYKTFYPDDNRVVMKPVKIGNKVIINADEVILGLDSEMFI